MVDLWAPFDGAATSPEPLTWGQRAIWKAYSEFRPNTAWLNISRVLAVPGRSPRDIDTVLRAIGQLVSRHESLRTRIAADPELRQVPAASGRLPVSRAELGRGSNAQDPRAGLLKDALGEAATPESIKDALGEVPYDYEAEWPLRATLVTERGLVTHLALVFSHVAVDLHASEILLRELRLLLLRGRAGGAAGLQSVDIARLERGSMKHRSDRARDYWLGHYAHLPESMFAPSGRALTPRFRQALLVSRAADIAMRIIATRHRVSTATVLLAATAALIGGWTGHDRCALFTMVNNRHQPGYQDAISKLNQVGLFALDLSDRPDFGELIPRTWQAATRAYRHAYYDPCVMDAAISGVGRRTGSSYEPWCYFNDQRLPGLIDSPPATTDESKVRAALHDSTLTWPESLDRFAWQFRLQVVDAADGVGLTLTADTERLSPPRMEQFLRELEQLIVTAAFTGVPWPSGCGGISPRSPT